MLTQQERGCYGSKNNRADTGYPSALATGQSYGTTFCIGVARPSATATREVPLWLPDGSYSEDTGTGIDILICHCKRNDLSLNLCLSSIGAHSSSSSIPYRFISDVPVQ